MFLSKYAIIEAYHAKKIVIDPFDPEQLNPNSYDVRLGPILKRVHGGMDMKLEPAKQQVDRIEIPSQGYLLLPGCFYLGCTFERAGSDFYVAMLDGKSSVARTGLEIHVSAGFGDVGFTGRWTLEISVKLPTMVYPFQRIGQVSFHKVTGKLQKYTGQYDQKADMEPVESRMFKTMERDAVAMGLLYQEWVTEK